MRVLPEWPPPFGHPWISCHFHVGEEWVQWPMKSSVSHSYFPKTLDGGCFLFNLLATIIIINIFDMINIPTIINIIILIFKIPIFNII